MKSIITGVLSSLLLVSTGSLAQPGSTEPAYQAHNLPAPMSRIQIEQGLKEHNQALFIKAGWIRDPYIVLGPDDFYYLTGTTPNPDDPRQQSDPYNIGLGEESIVGQVVQLWRSKDLIDWEYLGTPFTLNDRFTQQQHGPAENRQRLWAPEIHWMGDRWALVHCPEGSASFALAQPGTELKGPWTHPMQGGFGERHDPSLFQDDDGSWYVLYGNTLVQPLSDDLSQYTAPATRIDPAGKRMSPAGKSISRIGHEGATIRKIGNKYVHFGTAWSTDSMRKGSYNLYYSTADTITGPYGPRKFVGRFLGHGTPFQTRDGKWWVTAFFNANVPPLDKAGIQSHDLSETAQTINPRGTTIVPLEVRVEDNGDVFIRAKDPDYANPGPDEAQNFTAVQQGS